MVEQICGEVWRETTTRDAHDDFDDNFVVVLLLHFFVIVDSSVLDS